MAALYVFLTRSWYGRALRAMSQDLDAARQMGVPVDRLRQIAFRLGAALAAVAGVMIATYHGTVYPQMGVAFGLKGFTAALHGGLASIPGAVLGGLLLGVLEALTVGYIGEGFRDMVAYSLLHHRGQLPHQGRAGRPACAVCRKSGGRHPGPCAG